MRWFLAHILGFLRTRDIPLPWVMRIIGRNHIELRNAMEMGACLQMAKSFRMQEGSHEGYLTASWQTKSWISARVLQYQIWWLSHSVYDSVSNPTRERICLDWLLSSATSIHWPVHRGATFELSVYLWSKYSWPINGSGEHIIWNMATDLGQVHQKKTPRISVKVIYQEMFYREKLGKKWGVGSIIEGKLGDAGVWYPSKVPGG